jgi:hypothetical protein
MSNGFVIGRSPRFAGCVNELKGPSNEVLTDFREFPNRIFRTAPRAVTSFRGGFIYLHPRNQRHESYFIRLSRAS